MLSMNSENGNFTDSVNSNLTVSPAVAPQPNCGAMDSLKKIVTRIEKRLTAVGLSAAAASRDAGLSDSAIYNLRRGATGKIATKGANASTFSKLAPVLRTSPEWLMSGTGPEVGADEHIDSAHILQDEAPGQRLVRIVGYVGAGSAPHFYALADDSFEEVIPPAGSNDKTVALEIRGKSFGPLLDTWLVFYDDVRSPITEDLHGEVCVVGLSDDRILLKKIQRNRDGSFTLISNASGEEPIRNAKIEWAAKVIDIRPRQ
jgi:hypothetical protein